MSSQEYQGSLVSLGIRANRGNNLNMVCCQGKVRATVAIGYLKDIRVDIGGRDPNTKPNLSNSLL